MSCEDKTAKAFRENGLRVTPQRSLVLSTLRHAHGHLGAREILERVRQVYPYVDLSTVYRSLVTLKQLGFVSEIDLGGDEFLYEWVEQQRHHHLICKQCGKTTALDHSYFDSFAAQLMEDLGFAADIGHFAIFGICAACREAVVPPDSADSGEQLAEASRRHAAR